MSIHVRVSGTYELIETIARTTILGLDGEKWFEWRDENEDEQLLLSGDDHYRRRLIDQGAFLLIDFEDESEYRDMLHLFLGHHGTFEEYILPNGLPDQADARKKIISTNITIGKEELERYLASGGSDREEQSSEVGEDLPVDDYETLSVDEIAEQLVELTPKEIEKLRQHEETHQDRKSLRRLFNRHLESVH